MAGQGHEQARYKGMLESLQAQDYEIEHIVAYSKFVVAYLLQQEGPNPGWRKANIEGPVYLVRRRRAPIYQLLVKNQFSNNDLRDNLHPDWELDCQKNYVFYKVEDPSKQIHGLWFHDDSERQKLEKTLETVLEELRNNKTSEPHLEPGPRPVQDNMQQADAGGPPGGNAQIDSLYAHFGLKKPEEGGAGNAAAQQQVAARGGRGGESITITRESLRSALHALVDDENFLSAITAKLQEHSH